jgi:opacity protein-like surface antigen
MNANPTSSLSPWVNPKGSLPSIGFLVLMVTAATATPAQAQWIGTPYIGVNLAGDAEFRRGGVGAAFGYIGDRLGAELDVERHHHFFKDKNVDLVPNNCAAGGSPACIDLNTRAWRLMGHVVAPLRGRGQKWRPYGTAGFGVIRPWIEGPGDRYDVKQSDFAFSVGGGVIYSRKDRVGFRADVRYLRGLVDESKREGAYFRDYGFLHASVGLTVRLHGR